MDFINFLDSLEEDLDTKLIWYLDMGSDCKYRVLTLGNFSVIHFFLTPSMFIAPSVAIIGFQFERVIVDARIVSIDIISEVCNESCGHEKALRHFSLFLIHETNQYDFEPEPEISEGLTQLPLHSKSGQVN